MSHVFWPISMYNFNNFTRIFKLNFRGADFRPDYIKSVELRSIFSNAPCLGLSATVNEKVLPDIMGHLHLYEHQVKVISAPPDRPNIFLEVVHKKSYDFEEDLMWVVEGVKNEKEKYPKTLIFAQSVSQVSDIYEFMRATLGKNAYSAEGGDYHNRLLSMYHGQIAEALQKYTLDVFRKEDSVLRVLICTIAFGMGVEIPDVRQVVHWGKSRSLLCHWQEIGRCGRDGEPAKAIWFPKTTAGEDKELFDKLKNDDNICIRKCILESFKLPNMDLSLIHALDSRAPCTRSCELCDCTLCRCCSHCRQKCACFSSDK